MDNFDINNSDVIRKAKEGDNEYLDAVFNEFRPYIIILSNKYYLAGAEKDDLIQEGMIGLFKAVRDYKEDFGVPFKSFATVCIQRQIKTAMKLAARKKHIPLNSSVSLQANPFEDSDSKAELVSCFEDKSELNPEEIYINNETFNQLNKLIYDSLSKFELNILMLYNQGLSYKRIAYIVGKSVKSIDNAVQRIKRKVEVIKKEYMSL